jgi:hypothetical protein
MCVDGPVRSLVAVVVAAAVLSGCGDDVATPPRAAPQTGPSTPTAEAAPAADDPAPAGWRTEYWHDVQLEVPDDWWYGASVMRLPHHDGDLACGWGAMVSPEGEWGDPRRVGWTVQPGYVGRPIVLDETCGSVDQGSSIPVEPYVWFDSTFPVGTRRLAEGWVEQTWEVEGVVLTVATTDPATRRHVVESARGGETCLADRGDLADPLATPQQPEDDAAVVCAYRRERGEAWLTYAATLAPEAAADFVERFDAAPDWPLTAGRACDVGGDDEWVVLQVDGRAYVVRPRFHGCPHVQGGERTVRLAPELLEPWFTGGLPAVLLSLRER